MTIFLNAIPLKMGQSNNELRSSVPFFGCLKIKFYRIAQPRHIWSHHAARQAIASLNNKKSNSNLFETSNFSKTRDRSLTQITAGSLTGFWGPGPKKACETLLKKNLVHVIASDAHDSGRRSPVLSESRKAAAKIVGDKHATALVSEIPAAIVRGELL